MLMSLPNGMELCGSLIFGIGVCFSLYGMRLAIMHRTRCFLESFRDAVVAFALRDVCSNPAEIHAVFF